MLGFSPIGASPLGSAPSSPAVRRGLSAAAGLVIATGRPAWILRGYTLPAAGGQATLTTASTRIGTMRRLSGQAVAFVLVGTPVAFVKIGVSVLMAQAGALVATGCAATLSRSRRLLGGPAAYDLVAPPAEVGRSRQLIAAASAFILDLLPASIVIRVAGSPAPGWALQIPPRRFTASVARRLFLISSSGCSRMLNFPPKYAHEVRHAAINFAPDLSQDETLTGAPTVEVIAGDIVVSGARIDGATVRFTLAQGTAASRVVQTIEVHCSTSAGQTLEEVISVTMMS